MTDYEWMIIRFFSLVMLGLIAATILGQVFLFYAIGIDPYWVTHEPFWMSL